MSSTRNKDRNIIKLNTETSHAETLACDAYRPGAKRGSKSMERTAGLLRAGQVGPSRPPLCQEREGRAWSAAHPPSPPTPASHPPRRPHPPRHPHPPRLDQVRRAGKHHTHRDGSRFIPHHRALLPRELPTFRPQGTVDRGRGRPLRAAAGGPSDRAQREDRPLRTGLLQGKGRVGRRGRRAAGRTAEFSSGASEGSSAVRDPNTGGKTWGRTHWPCGRRCLPGTAMSSIPKPLRIHPETESGRGNDRRQTARED